MKTDCNEITIAELETLLYEREDTLESAQIARHVETCDACQLRLAELLDQDGIEREASQLLNGYVGGPAHTVRASASSKLDGDVAGNLDQELLGAPSHPEMFGRIGRYEIERRVGAGGMGVVFKAIDTELNRTVAIKVLAPHLARSGAARQRFSRESRAAAAVVHEHVVAIHNVDSSGEYPYLVMQYVSGESLQARVDRDGPLGVERILRVGIQAALGLAAAHEQGIVHRDIKPANILLEDGVDRLLITDFGLARTVDDASLTHTGVVAGTPSYMSPEQATGDEVDHRTDLFSLGSVLYFAATGHPPFRAERAMGVLHRICHQPHRPLWQVNASIPDDLSDCVDRLLEKRPGKRFADAQAVADVLTRLLHRVQHRRPSMLARMNSWGRRHKATAMMVATSVFVVIGAFSLAARLIIPQLVAMKDRSFVPSNIGGPKMASDGGMMLDAGSREGSLMGMEESNQPPTVQRPSAQSATAKSSDANLYPPNDREEFNQSLNAILQSLDSIEMVPTYYEADSFLEYQIEMHSLAETLKKIDPTIPLSKK